MIPDEIAYAAACRGDDDKELVMEWLAEHPEGVNDLDNDGATLLLLSVEDREFTREQLELVRYLISRGADPNRICTVITEEGSAVHQAAGGKNSPHSQHVLACLRSRQSRRSTYSKTDIHNLGDREKLKM